MLFDSTQGKKKNFHTVSAVFFSPSDGNYVFLMTIHQQTMQTPACSPMHHECNSSILHLFFFFPSLCSLTDCSLLLHGAGCVDALLINYAFYLL